MSTRAHEMGVKVKGGAMRMEGSGELERQREMKSSVSRQTRPSLRPSLRPNQIDASSHAKMGLKNTNTN
jgi:hypothetical protein